MNTNEYQGFRVPNSCYTTLGKFNKTGGFNSLRALSSGNVRTIKPAFDAPPGYVDNPAIAKGIDCSTVHPRPCEHCIGYLGLCSAYGNCNLALYCD